MWWTVTFQTEVACGLRRTYGFEFIAADRQAARSQLHDRADQYAARHGLPAPIPSTVELLSLAVER